MFELTKEYDYNVYVYDGMVSLSAYQQEVNQFGHVQTRTDVYHTLKFDFDESNREEISYLLNSEDWPDDYEYWEEHDEWVSLDDLTMGDTPEAIKNFLDNLPGYVMNNDYN